ncbi:MAG: LysM peptidoglycan-binding domain-containing protein [Firmicutes bacterium]|nr:LysM peptidoglycan-binding domain-containing protein [Bacillota bacterium]
MKYRITNRKRFITFLTAVIILSYLLVFGLVNIAFASDNNLKSTASVTVSAGDTLWEIAGDYVRPGNDIRNIVHEICILNGIRAGEIYPGQVLMIPSN